MCVSAMTDLIERLRGNILFNWAHLSHYGDDMIKAANEIERLNAIIKLGRRPGKSNLPYIKEIERLEAEIDAYQQRDDEIIVALGSKGILPSEIVAEIERLEGENRMLKDILNQLRNRRGKVWFRKAADEIERLEAKIRNVEILVDRAAHDRTYDGDLIDDIRDALDSKEQTT